MIESLTTEKVSSCNENGPGVPHTDRVTHLEQLYPRRLKSLLPPPAPLPLTRSPNPIDPTNRHCLATYGVPYESLIHHQRDCSAERKAAFSFSSSSSSSECRFIKYVPSPSLGPRMANDCCSRWIAPSCTEVRSCLLACLID